MKKIIGLILVLAILAAGGLYVLRLEQADDDRMRDLYSEVEPLERQRETLLDEKSGLSAQYALKMRDYGTIEVLFRNLDTQIFSYAYPAMRDHGIVGVLPVSSNEMPGDYGKLTADEFQKLLADGWGTCLVYENVWGGFTYWYQQMVNFLRYKGITLAPTAVYFPNDDYDSSLDEELVACGIEVIVLNGTDGRSRTVTPVTGDLWTTYAMPWNYTGSSADLELLGRTDSSNLVFVMTFNEVWDKTLNHNVDSQEYASFVATLDKWEEDEILYEEDLLEDMEKVGPTPNIYLNSNDPDVLHELYLSELTPEQLLLLSKVRSENLMSALNYHREALQNADKLNRELEQREEEIDQEVASLEQQILAVYERYGVSSKTDEGKEGTRS